MQTAKTLSARQDRQVFALYPGAVIELVFEKQYNEAGEMNESMTENENIE
jgi:hypothetical protein